MAIEWPRRARLIIGAREIKEWGDQMLSPTVAGDTAAATT
jgi:hypothetical protein